MSYLITDERYTECFEKHVATLKVLNEDTQTLEWKEPGTRIFQVDYVFHKNMLLVSGDLGEASFACTWQPKWDTNNGWMLSIDYLFEKLSAIRDGKYTWDSDYAISNLKERYEELFDELDKGEFENMSAYIINLIGDYVELIRNKDDLINSNVPHHEVVDNDILLQYCKALRHAINSSSQSEFVYGLQHDNNFNDFNDFWEWGYQCGCRINPRIKYYLAGLQMAYAQLKEREVK